MTQCYPPLRCGRSDYEGKRSGTVGRFINDDPAKYPGRDGWLTGGWAGGEAGLQQFVEVRPLAPACNGCACDAPAILLPGMAVGRR